MRRKYLNWCTPFSGVSQWIEKSLKVGYISCLLLLLFSEYSLCMAIEIPQYRLAKIKCFTVSIAVSATSRWTFISSATSCWTFFSSPTVLPCLLYIGICTMSLTRCRAKHDTIFMLCTIKSCCGTLSRVLRCIYTGWYTEFRNVL